MRSTGANGVLTGEASTFYTCEHSEPVRFVVRLPAINKVSAPILVAQWRLLLIFIYLRTGCSVAGNIDVVGPVRDRTIWRLVDGRLPVWVCMRPFRTVSLNGEYVSAPTRSIRSARRRRFCRRPALSAVPMCT